MGHYDDDEYYGDWYHDGFLMEDPADWYHDLDSPFDPTDEKYEPEITDRDWPIGIESGEHKWVYIVVVAKQTIKIGSCNPSIKHLKNRICEAKRWNAKAKLLAVKLNSSIEEEKFLHKALDAKKEIVTFSNSILDKARYVLVRSRFTFVSGKIKNLKIGGKSLEFNAPLEYVKKLPKGLDSSAYCKDESEIYQKIKLFESDCRLSTLYEKMLKRGWCWEEEDSDDWGRPETHIVDDGRHCKMVEVLKEHFNRGYELSEEGAFHTNIRLKSKK